MDKRDPLNLKSLPSARAPDDLWPAIEQRLQPRQRRWPWAAGLAAAVLLGLVTIHQHDTPPLGQDVAISHLQEQSALMEELIIPLRPAALSGEAAQREATIESMLTAVDRALFYAPDNIDLWTRRVQLLDALAVTYSEDWIQQQRQLTLL